MRAQNPEHTIDLLISNQCAVDQCIQGTLPHNTKFRIIISLLEVIIQRVTHSALTTQRFIDLTDLAKNLRDHSEIVLRGQNGFLRKIKEKYDLLMTIPLRTVTAEQHTQTDDVCDAICIHAPATSLFPDNSNMAGATSAPSTAVVAEGFINDMEKNRVKTLQAEKAELKATLDQLKLKMSKLEEATRQLVLERDELRQSVEVQRSLTDQLNQARQELRSAQEANARLNTSSSATISQLMNRIYQQQQQPTAVLPAQPTTAVLVQSGGPSMWTEVGPQAAPANTDPRAGFVTYMQPQ